jgi:ligand-binding SRPBCC domain-containing protein
MPSFAIASTLHASAAQVWAHATSMAGVNDELGPLMRMTYPADRAEIGGQVVPLGTPLFRSIILLFGVLPIDYDEITFEALEPGRRFVESSRTMSQRVWRHERTVDPVGDGCTVTDRVTFVPKVAAMERLLLPALSLLFAHRHWRLIRRFGGELGVVHRG